MTVTYKSCDSKRKIGIGFFLKTEIEILIEAIINFTFSNEIIFEKLKKIILKRFPRNSNHFCHFITAFNRGKQVRSYYLTVKYSWAYESQYVTHKLWVIIKFNLVWKFISRKVKMKKKIIASGLLAALSSAATSKGTEFICNHTRSFMIHQLWLRSIFCIL